MRWLGAVLFLSACAGDLGEPRFSLESCRTVELIDEATGTTVVGAEDLALTDAQAAIWVSAYDRRSNAPGGVYRIGVTQLDTAVLRLSPLVGGIRPHGIAASGERSASFISRQEDGTAAIETVVDGVEGASLRTDRGAVPCGANDLTLGFGETTYTVDREVCEGAVFERLFQGKAGRIERLAGAPGDELRPLAEGMRLPNGITEFDGELWIAEMRAKRLISLDRETIGLPGAPDNLNASSEGIVAALQPSLWRFGLYRYGYLDKAPTRIVLVDPHTEEIELLYDDPKGRQLSGATAAVLTDGGMMVASSVRGDRLLVCEATGG